MLLTVQDGAVRAVFSDAPVTLTDRRGLYISVEVDADGKLVAVAFTKRLVAAMVVKMLAREFNLSLSEQDASSILTAL